MELLSHRVKIIDPYWTRQLVHSEWVAYLYRSNLWDGYIFTVDYFDFPSFVFAYHRHVVFRLPLPRL